ncbi:aldehyde dehydrogenase family protein [Flaviflexus ciconiae]|uniref:aldehyde dehydrogenase family protein n=1 Tax=Flaviflexus ciconiae TaxID=2496867 RepID=UPI0022499611|nr:aldehyde dehydrogenase family protein [Flaviflexus ciconiae]
MAINQPTTASYKMSFGGTKRSGYGKEMGVHGIREFTPAKVLYYPPEDPSANPTASKS